MLLPSALGSSPHPPVSVYGTGTYGTIAAFLGTALSHFATKSSLCITHLDPAGSFSVLPPYVLAPAFPSPVDARQCVPTVLTICGTGISTCCPSATPFGLALGPDLPRADQLYPGNLGYSAGRILTSLSLLIPAFSLPKRPPSLSIWLLPLGNAPLPIY